MFACSIIVCVEAWMAFKIVRKRRNLVLKVEKS